MHIEFPEYYKDFSCTASKCSDNCCIGWEIDIDEKTHELYQNTDGEFGARLRLQIESGTPAHFKLHGERCAFLNQDNLCDIILNLGEHYLCEICKNHPRFFTQCENHISMGIGLCCEEAVRLILDDIPVSFSVKEDGKTQLGNRCRWLLSMKSRAISHMQNRDIPIKNRLFSLLLFAEKLQNNLDCEKYDLIDIPKCANCEKGSVAAHELIKLHQKLEVLDPDWKLQLDELGKTIDVLSEYTDEFEKDCPQLPIICEQISVYFLHRYWMQCGNDGDLLGKVHLMLCAVLTIRLLCLKSYSNQSLEHDLNWIVKAYSKEIEYSEDNLEILANASIEDEFFYTESLRQAIFW